MKPVNLQSCEGDLFPLSLETTSMCTTIKNMLKGGRRTFSNALGGQFCIEGNFAILKKEGRVLASVANETDSCIVISLPEVKTATLQKVIEYCEFHSLSSSLTDKEKKNWDSDFVKVKQNILCELASASYNLDIKSLVLLTSRAIATQISGKSSEEIRESFSCSNYDYSPLISRYRIHRKINRKSQDYRKCDEKSTIEDDRPLDELLSFINGDSETRLAKNKKKNKKKEKKKDMQRLSKSQEINFSDERELQIQRSHSTEHIYNSSSCSMSIADDELDPEMIAVIDKEVEDFRQRLETMNKQSLSMPKMTLPIATELLMS
eukprot:TRINITY_DN13084_c0_g1_i1.p1 TRINITY_DN13084_c0_g1~~TRINITY_DN13084_c0_g1_i1.p1  ORF type:complete len:320 (+),score=56.72 TRINITY_DN13084_c0_g1_i1:1-960(+)